MKNNYVLRHKFVVGDEAPINKLKLRNMNDFTTYFDEVLKSVFNAIVCDDGLEFFSGERVKIEIEQKNSR